MLVYQSTFWVYTVIFRLQHPPLGGQGTLVLILHREMSLIMKDPNYKTKHVPICVFSNVWVKGNGIQTNLLVVTWLF